MVKQLTVDATFLQDGQWEKDYANSIRTEFIKVPNMIQTLITGFYELMNTSNGKEKSLNSFVVCAN
ncbi:hypothetical protein [Peribacillus frigoritolerans]|uniref:hypothetical protein n=1 Tax=Peribacillus frigoritolerans TaxID=450367 RepID=UPI002E2414EC|nr:hypothetical protein [Peribacillus frigoritolerans]